MDHPRAVTILLVEDDDGHARLLERNLRRGGMINRLVRVSDGQQALDYLSRNHPYQDLVQYPVPSVVLLDVRMPRMDGFEVLAHMKSNPALMKTPVIMLTSTDNQKEIDRAYEMGANGYVVKPVAVESFIDRVVKLGMFIEVIEFQGTLDGRRMEQLTNDILLVEDDPGQARLAQKALERAGFEVRHVGAAAACLDHVRRDPPTFVLLDRGLPDGDGLDVLRTLRAEFPSVCVIMLTGSDDAGVAVDAMQVGALDYVVKRPDLSHFADLPRVLDRNRERLRLLREHDTLNRAVRASEERYRELFDNASDAIFVCDNVGVLQQVNEAFVSLTGCRREDIEGRDLGGFLAPTSPTRAPGLRERSTCAGIPSTAEVHLLAHDGHATVLDVTTRPMLVGGAVTGFQGIGRDVTQRRQVEQMKADFLAMVTHDMKNPVSIIVGYAEILLNDAGLMPEWREMLVSIDSSARGLLHLIMNFLDLSKIEAGALRLHRVETCLNDILRQVVQYQRPLARAKRIEVVEEFAPLPSLPVDRTQMDRVFVNLIGNAIKFTPPAGRVSVGTTSDNGRIEVRISDTGPGIPTDQLPQLFGKYQRLAPAVETEGTGLGLFIAKSMIEAHGGIVRAESSPNSGATFIVSFPLVHV